MFVCDVDTSSCYAIIVTGRLRYVCVYTGIDNYYTCASNAARLSAGIIPVTTGILLITFMLRPGRLLVPVWYQVLVPGTWYLVPTMVATLVWLPVGSSVCIRDSYLVPVPGTY